MTDYEYYCFFICTCVSEITVIKTKKNNYNNTLKHVFLFFFSLHREKEMGLNCIFNNLSQILLVNVHLKAWHQSYHKPKSTF